MGNLLIMKISNRGGVSRSYRFRHEGEYVFGRARDTDIRLPENDPYISRRHFILSYSPTGSSLKNLSEKNPVQINGKPVSKTVINHGDVIEAGYTKIIVQLVPATNQTVTCKCGADLSQFADSDGQALDLGKHVEYRCRNCILKKYGKPKGTVDGYWILNYLGAGAMGKVYLVFHPETSRVLAMKQITEMAEGNLVKRFLREIRILRDLSHDNLIQYVDSSSGEKKPYFVMSFADSGNLQNLLFDEGPIPYPVAFKLVADSLDGLDYIHKKGIIHRDLKPENIVLHRTNSTLVPKITDFGIAKKYTNEEWTMLTGQKQVFGSIFFMSPQQILDFQNVREAADLYSLGVSLFYLLTGRFPFDYPSPYEIQLYIKAHDLVVGKMSEALRHMGETRSQITVLEMIIRNEPIPIRERFPDFPEECAEVVDRALLKSGDCRYTSAAEFRDALREHF